MVAMTENGISTTKTAGTEQYSHFWIPGGCGHSSSKHVQYDYRAADGTLFSCTRKTLKLCRIARDNWLHKTGREA